MENQKQMPIVVGPDDGKIWSVAGGNYRILISGKQTHGEFAVVDMMVPPGSGPGPHSHANFYESFYIVDGEVEVYAESGYYTAKRGAYVVIPKGGVVHYFKNISDKMAHLLCTVMPAGLEEFFEEIGVPAAAGEFHTPLPMDSESIRKLASAAESHGQILYPPDFLAVRKQA